MANHTIKVDPHIEVLTPYAQARSAHHLFSMAKAYNSEQDAWLMRLYLFGAAIELGMKAAILGEDCTQAKKDFLKQAIRHDLLKLDAHFASTFGASLFDESDHEALSKINEHFKNKGLEYFTLPVLAITLSGGKALPEVQAMEAAAAKVDAFLEARNFIIEGKTSQAPSGGIINFV